MDELRAKDDARRNGGTVSTSTGDSDVALTLLHTADWHLGRRFPSFEREQEQRLTRARLDVVGRILDVAESRNVDAVLCAGDLFDEPEPERLWWHGVLQEFQRRHWRRPVVLLPGNHDPLTGNSIYHHSHAFRHGLPDYVHVVDESGWELSVGDNAIVVATPCTSSAGDTKLVESLPQREDGDERIRVGLVHGQTFDIDGHQTNFPIPRGSAAERGLDYLAIGDTHAFREVEQGAFAPTVYPGAPEATNFGERDTGNVAVVFFPLDRRRRPLVHGEPVGSWRWRDETCNSMSQLRSLAEESDLGKTVLRLKLDMTVPLADYDEAERILDLLGGSLATTPRVGVLNVDREGLRLLTDEAMAEFNANMPTVLRATAERLQALAQGDDPVQKEHAERALHHLYRLVQDAA